MNILRGLRAYTSAQNLIKSTLFIEHFSYTGVQHKVLYTIKIEQ